MVECSQSPFMGHFPQESLDLLDGVSSQIFLNNLSEEMFRFLLENILSGGPGGNPRPMFETTMIHRHLLPLVKAFGDMLESGKSSDANFFINAPMNAGACLAKHHNFTILAPSRAKLISWYWKKVKKDGNITFQELFKKKKRELDELIDLNDYLTEYDINVEIFKLTKRDLKICTFLAFLNNKGFENILDFNEENISNYVERILKGFSAEPNEREKQILIVVAHNISLHIKGAYKSMMGMILEDPVLFSAFSACGLNYETRGGTPTGVNSFTLDAPKQGKFERQADAVIKLPNDRVLYVDIGFVGPGNPEISSDKQTRFKAAGEDSIIIISRVPDKGKVKGIADKTKAKVVQMCDEDWVHKLLVHLRSKGYTGQESIETLVPDTEDILGAMKDGVSRPESW